VLVEPLPQARRAEPAVLVVDAGHAARVRELHAAAHRVDVFLVGNSQIALLEPPRRFFEEDTGRLPVGVALDEPAVGLEVAARQRERGRVEPQRVVVLRDQRGRPVARDRVEVVLRRQPGVRPVGVPPAVAADPGALRPAVTDPRERLVERRDVIQLDLVLRDRPGGEVHVRVGEARQDAASAEVDRLGACERCLVHTDAAGNPVARDRHGTRDRQRRIERSDDAVLEDHAAETNERRGEGASAGRQDGGGANPAD
jgi:hypothetical protein